MAQLQGLSLADIAGSGAPPVLAPADFKKRAREIAEEIGVDFSLVERLIKQESGWKQDVTSVKGAKGLMQLMPGTAKTLGVNADDPEDNLRGGITYLKTLLDKYEGDEVKAVAAYNAGPGNVDKHDGVPPFKETEGYVRAILGNDAVPARTITTPTGGAKIVPLEGASLQDLAGPSLESIAGKGMTKPAAKPAPAKASAFTPTNLLKAAVSPVPAVQAAGRSLANRIEGVNRSSPTAPSFSETIQALFQEAKASPLRATGSLLAGLTGVPSVIEAGTHAIQGLKEQFTDTPAYSPRERELGFRTVVKDGKIQVEKGAPRPVQPTLGERARYAVDREVGSSAAGVAGVVEGTANLSPAEVALIAAGKKVGKPIVRGQRLIQGGKVVKPQNVKPGAPVTVEPIMGRETLGGRTVRKAVEKLRGDRSKAPNVAPPMADDALQDLASRIDEIRNKATGTPEVPNVQDLRPTLVKGGPAGQGTGPRVAPQQGSALDKYLKKAINEPVLLQDIRKSEARLQDLRKQRGKLQPGSAERKTIEAEIAEELARLREAQKPMRVDLAPSEPPPMPKTGSRQNVQTTRVDQPSLPGIPRRSGEGIPDPGGNIGHERASGYSGPVNPEEARATRRKARDEEIDRIVEEASVDYNNRKRPPTPAPPGRRGGATVETPRAASPEEVSAFVAAKQAGAAATPGTKPLPSLAKKGIAAQSTPSGGGISAANAPVAGDLSVRRRNLLQSIKRASDKTGDAALDKKLKRFHYLAELPNNTPEQAAEIVKLQRDILGSAKLPEKLKASWMRYNEKVARPAAEAGKGKNAPVAARTGVTPVTHDPRGIRIPTAQQRVQAGHGTMRRMDEAVQKEVKLEKELRSAERAAETDPLTGVANRRALDKALPTAEADPNTHVVAFDANNFGQVNKKVSQAAGDKMLKEVATAVKAAADEHGVGERVFRRGGDEFVVIAPKDVADKVRARAEELFGTKQAGDVEVSLSGTTANTFADADAILQDAKKARKAQTETPAVIAIAEERARPLAERSQEMVDRVIPEAKSLQIKEIDLKPAEADAAVEEAIEELLGGAKIEGRIPTDARGGITGLSAGEGPPPGPIPTSRQAKARALNIEGDFEPVAGAEKLDPRAASHGTRPPTRTAISAPQGFTFGGRDHLKTKQAPAVREARDKLSALKSRGVPKVKPAPETPKATSAEDIKLSAAAGPDAKPIKRQTIKEQQMRQRMEVAKGAPKGINPAQWRQVQAAEAVARDLIEKDGIADPRLVSVMNRFWGLDETAQRLGLDKKTVEHLIKSPNRRRPLREIQAEMDDRMRKLMNDPEGFFRVEALVAATGAITGGLVGASLEGDNAFDEVAYTVSGALLGGAIGMSGARGLRGFRARGQGIPRGIRHPLQSAEALDTANMLAGPAAVKASLGSVGASAIGIVQRILEGNYPAARAGLRYAWKQAPTVWWRALTAPTASITGPYTARIVQGTGTNGLPQRILANVTRPFAAADQAGAGILKAAGFSQAEAERLMLMGEPTSWQGQAILNIINDNMAYRLLAKFPRVRIAQFERGMEYLPGVPYRKSPRSLKADAKVGRVEFRQQEGLSRSAWNARKKIGATIMLAGSAYGYWREPSLAEMGLVSSVAGPAALPASISMAAGKAIKAGQDPITEALVTAVSSTPQISEADVRRWQDRAVPLRSLRRAVGSLTED